MFWFCIQRSNEESSGGFGGLLLFRFFLKSSNPRSSFLWIFIVELKCIGGTGQWIRLLGSWLGSVR